MYLLLCPGGLTKGECSPVTESSLSSPQDVTVGPATEESASWDFLLENLCK